MQKDTEQQITSPWQTLLEGLRNRPDSEHEQALIRIIIVTCVMAYLLIFREASYGTVSNGSLAAVFGSLLVFSVAMLAAILLRPGKSAVRRIVGMVIDLGMTTYWMSVTGELGSPWYPLYLWISFGYGFRYGVKYLYLSAALSVAGFSIVLMMAPFWAQHTGLSMGLLIALIVLPGYVAPLLKRITQERKRAEEANRSKSDFLARMSHEIRTPLNGIIGSGELLRSCNLASEEREYADTIHASGETLLRLIEDILDISKIESGVLTLEQVDFDLHELIHSTVRMFQLQAKANGIQVGSSIGLDTPFSLHGDVLHLRQILTNLVGNAIKFTGEGSVDLRCNTIRRGRNRSLIHFEVVDTGIGIPEAVQHHIFEKFSQGDESTTRRYGGTGLGTAIARQLVELMGGRIGFRSTPGIGTEFWFDIEFTQQVADETSLQKLQDCRVLRLSPTVGDDTEVVRYLDDWSVSYRNVRNGREALRLLNAEHLLTSPFEVLILDRMPVDAGIQNLLLALRTRAGLQDLTVLIIGGEGQDIPAQDTGANTVYTLPSPVDKSLLFNALHASHVRPFDNTGVINLTEHITRGYAIPRKLKILVAEDNATSRMVVGRLLERAGHDCRLVKDGQEALDALQQDAFDLAIVDMHMPVADGIEVFRLYRFANAGKPGIPFVMLTANATVEARQDCKEAGIQYFLTKPVSSSLLLKIIARAAGDAPLEECPGSGNVIISAGSRARPLVVVDRDVLADIACIGSSSDFVQKLMQQFLHDGQQLLQGMKDALNGNDMLHFTDLAHALKGSAAYLGLLELADQASRANALVDGEPAQCRDCLQHMEAAFVRAKAALETELEHAKPALH
ncbi:MAG: ATP-binding protein [Gammaproteobacteria bacterium]|nr:ATP-binding protein [Gammaproteobacteria bacterium]